MALTIVKNLTDISLCESATNWTGPSTPTAGTTLVREGTNALGAQVSNTTANFIYAGSEISGGVDMTDKRIYLWVNVAGILDTLANGGIGIIIGDTTNQRGYYLAGKDNLSTLFSAAGWYCLVLDCSNLPTGFRQVLGSGAPTITAITRVGVTFKTTAKAQGTSLNCFWDAMRYGTGLTVYGATSSAPGTFEEIATDDADTATGKAYGIIRKIQPGVYGLQGDLIFGDDAGTNVVYFADKNAVVIVEDHVAGPGNPTPIQIKVVGNATAATQVFQLGLPVSSGDTERGASPVEFINANLDQPVVFDASDAHLDNLYLYGTVFRNFKYTSDPSLKFSADATLGPAHRLSGCTFDSCGSVDSGRVKTRNCVFTNAFGIGASGKAAALEWNANIDVKYSSFINNKKTWNQCWQEDNSAGPAYVDETTDINDADANDVQFPAGAGSNDAIYFGLANKFSSLRVNVGTAGAGTYTLTWEFWNGSAWTALSGVSDGTSNFKTSGENLVSFTFPTTWVKNVVNGSASLYYVRARRDAGTVTTDPLLTQAWPKKSHGVKHATAGTFDYTGLSFLGNEKDLWFSAASGDLTVNADPDSSPGTYTNDSSGTVTLVNTKTIKATCKNAAGLAIQGIRIRFERTSDGVLIAEGTTNASGVYSTGYNYAGDVAVKVIARLKGYVNNAAQDTITTDGLSVPFTMIRDQAVFVP